MPNFARSTIPDSLTRAPRNRPGTASEKLSTAGGAMSGAGFAAGRNTTMPSRKAIADLIARERSRLTGCTPSIVSRIPSSTSE